MSGMRRIRWLPTAKADVRRIDQSEAMHILDALDRFRLTGEGDVVKLKGTLNEFRLRVGDYRLRFTVEALDTLVIRMVRHRSEVYR